jgi:hypothetical protein
MSSWLPGSHGSYAMRGRGCGFARSLPGKISIAKAAGSGRWLVLAGAVMLVLANPASAKGQASGGENSPASPTAADIVQQLVEHNAERAQHLGRYTAQRHYHVEYRGFPHTAEADMVVDATCDGPTSRNFHVVSESGSHLLVSHVLKKLLVTEQEAAQNQRENALTPANYNFTLLGSVIDGGRRLYILDVEPKTARTLLYRGKIWVDGQDFAVVRIEAQPAKNPSFWITETQIHHTYAKTGDFWLPVQNKSVSKVRLGGTAVLTIDYGSYQFDSAAEPSGQPATASLP